MSSSLSLAQITDQFRAAMRAAGIELRGELRADGKLHRFHVEGDKAGSKNGWYVLHADNIPAGSFGSWKAEAHETWCADIGRDLSASEQTAQRARLKALQDERIEQDKASRAAARSRAQAIWESSRKSKPKDSHPYLARKKVRAHGLGQLKTQLVVPVRDSAGKLHGLQFIEPEGGKKFLTGTAKAGHYHAIGPKVVEVVAIAEGYATAATVHEALGWPVAVAFDKGNLRAVAEALRSRFQNAQIVLAADNDASTEGNPGKVAAIAAAAAVGGVVALPELESGQGSDWNDFAAVHGVEAVAARFKAVLAAAPVPVPGAPLIERGEGGGIAAAGDHPPSKERRQAFSVEDSGIWWTGVDQKGEALAPYRVGPPLCVAAELRGTDQQNWGLLLTFKDPDGYEHRWGMPLRMLAGSCEEMRGELLRLGYKVATSPKSRNLLTDFIQQAQPNERARSVERTGWYEQVFVLPETTVGQAEESVLFQSESAATHVYRERGELAEWKADVSDLCRGNSRLLFAVSAAFAAMLVHWAGEESGGFHFRGGSSTGKTTALRVAASVYGGSDYLHRWRATDNALEGLAAGHCDTLLILDELAQIDPRIAGEAAYLLSNGQGKHRAHRTGGGRAVLTWRLLFLSAGETSLADHMQQAGKRVHVGQETRLADIPADAGCGRGVFEELRGFKDGGALSRSLADSVRLYHGTAAPAFIRAVQRRLETIPDELKRARAEFVKRYVPAGADGQVSRVAGRFALVASAGELATSEGITGWEAGEATAGVVKCFQAWLGQRGGSGNLEPARMLAQVRHFLEQHGKSRFERWTADNEPGNYIIQNRAGFRRGELSAQGDSEEMFFILPEAFRSEVCSGLDHRAVARALADADCLKKEGARQYTRSVRPPGMGKVRCYVVTPAIFAGGAPDAEDGAAE